MSSREVWILAVESIVDCALCQNLESVLARLERIHDEKLVVLRDDVDRVRGYKHRFLRVEESDALLAMEIAVARDSPGR